jgi:hypothetical protein
MLVRDCVAALCARKSIATSALQLLDLYGNVIELNLTEDSRYVE